PPPYNNPLSLHDALPIFCAQQSTGSLTGIIEDSQGAIIPGAMITLINEQQGSVARTAITNEDGSFVFTPLQPATYTLVVDMPGLDRKSTRLNSSHLGISY